MIAAEYPNYPRKVNFNWINESFKIFQRDAGTWVLTALIFILIVAAISVVIEGVFILSGHSPFLTPSETAASPFAVYTYPTYWAFMGLSVLIGLPVNGFLYGGVFSMANKAVRGQSIDLGDLFSGGATIVNYIVYMLILTILSYLGVIALIVGCLVVTGLFYPGLAVLADGVGFADAFSKSFNAMKNNWLTAAGFVFVFGLLYMLSAVCCIGIFVTLPMMCITTSLAYRDMIGMPGASVEPVPAAPGVWPPPPSAAATNAPPPSFETPPPDPLPTDPPSAPGTEDTPDREI